MGKLAAQPPPDLSFAQTDAGEDSRFGESLRLAQRQTTGRHGAIDRSGADESRGWIRCSGGRELGLLCSSNCE